MLNALRSAASGGSAADLPPAAEIEAAVVDSLSNEREYRELLCALLQLCISLPPKDVLHITKVLFVCGLSNMGTRVQVDEPKQKERRVQDPRVRMAVATPDINEICHMNELMNLAAEGGECGVGG